MDTLEKLNDISNFLSDKAELLRSAESSDSLSYIISISSESSDKDDSIYRINVDYYEGIADNSLIVLVEENFKPVLGDFKIKEMVDNGRHYEDGYNYYSCSFYI